MSVKIENYARRVEPRDDYDWYEWKVFVDEEPDVLNRIKEVIYLLHPTFKNPERVMRNQNEGFALEGSGWGSFDMTVTIKYIDRKVETQVYFLDLRKTWPV